MISTTFNFRDALGFVSEERIRQSAPAVRAAFEQLNSRTGRGNDFLGWLDLPMQHSDDLLLEIQAVAKKVSDNSDVAVVIGIGGSYLGTRAVTEALQHHFNACRPGGAPKLLYAGNSISEDYLHDLLEVLDNVEYSLIVISKSGTTTEPAIAFRVLKEHCENKYGKTTAAQRIFCITDANHGALRQLATNEGYTTFVIPDDVGGRYSVLTPVGLLPIAVAGFDIEKLLKGADEMRKVITAEADPDKNIAMQYAVVRNLLYQDHKTTELMVAYEPRLFYFIEWYKQLFGESEGKENKGIFPAGAIFSTDLHSLGQYIQEGERNLFETVISVRNAHHKVAIPYDSENIDGLNYLQQKSMNDINHTAEEGTRMAHVAGGVPNLRIEIDDISETTLGELIFFFEYSCALSGYMLNINPFNQPGVEAYKKNMFKLLGKPGI